MSGPMSSSCLHVPSPQPPSLSCTPQRLFHILVPLNNLDQSRKLHPEHHTQCPRLFARDRTLVLVQISHLQSLHAASRLLHP